MKQATRYITVLRSHLTSRVTTLISILQWELFLLRARLLFNFLKVFFSTVRTLFLLMRCTATASSML